MITNIVRATATGLVLAGFNLCQAAVYTVTVATDNVAVPPSGSLREAINFANGNTGTDSIEFAISSGAQSISLAGPLPVITEPVTLDATTQPGFGGSPLIELNGSGAGGGANLIELGAGSNGSVVRGFVINRFSTTGITINSSNGHTVSGNWLNLDAAGTAVSQTAGAFACIYVLNGAGSQIGGTTAADRNVMCGATYGVAMWFGAATANTVTGNWIGLLATGAAGTGPSFDCVSINNGSHHQIIGGTTAGSGNVLSNSGRWGVAIHGGIGGNTVQGNLIGTDTTGLLDFGHAHSGVYIVGSTDNLIGGNTSAARNVISGNSGWGVYIDGGATTNTIRSNYIGLGSDGNTVIPNGTGMEITQPGQIIGGAGAGNVISGNSGTGMNLTTNSSYSVVQGNIVGLNAAATAARPNGTNGIGLTGSFVSLGGTGAGEGNVISGNTGRGVVIQNATCTSNTVQGNHIGIDTTGTAAIGNSNDGLWMVNGTKYNLIGGSTPGARNVISGNVRGILVSDAGTGPNYIQGNYIGVNAPGNGALPNSAEGVYGANSAVAVVGGTGAGEGNIIAVNSRGVYNLNTTGLQVLGNRIGFNTNLGIDVSGVGVTANDGSGEADNFQNYPTIYTIDNDPGQITISGLLVTSANTVCRLEFFRDTSVDGSGYGEGFNYLGTHSVTSNGSGNASFTAVFPVTVSNGEYITATATTSARGTSEFSQARQAPYNFLVVTNTNDSGAGSLRQCITDAIGIPGHNTITFNIPGPGVKTIFALGNMVCLDPVTIDGTSQPGYSGTPLIEINGSGAGPNAGIVLANAGSSGSTIRGLTINRFPVAGIVLFNSNSNVIAGNWVGVDGTGTFAPGNSNSWPNIYVTNSALNTIGGTTAADRNVICGSLYGVGIWDPSSTTNTVAGNWIGVLPDGATPAGPLFDCVNIWDGAHHNTIGGTAAGSANVLSNATRWGIGIGTTSSPGGNTVLGNRIGTDATGTLDYGNGQIGVYIIGCPGNVIGGSTPAARNIISGNGGTGVYIEGSGAAGNAVLGNYIGTDVTGASALGNGGYGIFLKQGGQIIGGSGAGEGNIVSGNGFAGVRCESSAGNCTIRGNIIGLNASAGAAIPNGNGIEISGTAFNAIGGSSPGDRNIISGNSAIGVLFGDGATTNSVQGNIIGLDGTGTVDLGNGTDGVRLVSGASYNAVGNSTAAGRNIISGNNGNGVLMTDNTTLSNTVTSNYIGVAMDGATLIGNGGSGVLLGNTPVNGIGGTDSTAGNIIAGNSLGVRAVDTTGILILGNAVRDNSGLGIDIGPGGVTAADALDTDNVQNPPVISLVENGVTETTVTGTLSTSPSTTSRLEFFRNAGADPSGSGEGEQFMGAAEVASDGSGTAPFSVVLPVVTLTTDYISATATSAARGTSEFSGALLVPVTLSRLEME